MICDNRDAYLFFTCDDGTMWRAQTRLQDFPKGWSKPILALKGDIFEASHTYAVRGTGKYLTVIEAIGGGRRYYKSFTADALGGEWKPAGATWENPFAGRVNVAQPSGHWTDSISHGELFRAGIDQRMEIEPKNLKMLFQGVSDDEMRGKGYGEIPWRLGILFAEVVFLSTKGHEGTRIRKYEKDRNSKTHLEFLSFFVFFSVSSWMTNRVHRFHAGWFSSLSRSFSPFFASFPLQKIKGINTRIKRRKSCVMNNFTMRFAGMSVCFAKFSRNATGIFTLVLLTGLEARVIL